MFYIKIIIHLFFICLFQKDSFAEESILKTIDFGLVKTSSQYKFESSDDLDLTIQTNTKTNLEFASAIKNQLVSLKLPLEDQSKNKEEAKTNGYEIDYIFSHKRYLFNLNFHTYKGYNVENIGEGKKNKRIDIKTTMYRFEWSYFFSENFNLKILIFLS